MRQARDGGDPVVYGDADETVIFERVNSQGARAIMVVIDDCAAARRIVGLCRRLAPGRRRGDR